MTSTLVLHAAPAAGFDEPFELLSACHGRVERMLTLLEQLAEHLTRHGADEQARQAALDVMRYFDQAAPAHHEDEERHVFPAALARGDAALTALVRRLQAEHARMGSAWQAVRGELLGVSLGRWPAERAAAIYALWSEFAALYQGHAAAEDEIVFPAARQALTAPELKAMGEEMARRRGVGA